MIAEKHPQRASLNDHVDALCLPQGFCLHERLDELYAIFGTGGDSAVCGEVYQHPDDDEGGRHFQGT